VNKVLAGEAGIHLQVAEGRLAQIRVHQEEEEMQINHRHAENVEIPIRVHPEKRGMAIIRQPEKGENRIKVLLGNERTSNHRLEGEEIPINLHPDVAEVTPIRVRPGDVEIRMHPHLEGE